MVQSTISLYVGSKSSAREKITALDVLIDAFMLRLTDVVAGAAAVTDEYSIDDGQVKIVTSYRSVRDIEQGISSLIKLKNYYINKHNGHAFSLRDVRGLH